MSISTTQIPLAEHHDRNVEMMRAVNIQLLAEDEQYRKDIEQFIRLVFRRAYGARINHFLPYLLSMRQDNVLLAALGIRPAAEGRLFLENYLDKPVENLLAEKARRPIERSNIVEVGNLASIHGGGARALIITLTAYLTGTCHEWVVFTAVPRVRNNFAKLGIELLPLQAADKSRLGDEQHNWGSYYDQQPMVVAARVDQGATQIRQSLVKDLLFPTAQQLWDDAHRAGRQGRLWQPPRTLGTHWPKSMLQQDCDCTSSGAS